MDKLKHKQSLKIGLYQSEGFPRKVLVVENHLMSLESYSVARGTEIEDAVLR